MRHILAVLPLLATLSLTALEVYVAPAGNDANPGTAAQPLATLVGARDRVRQALAAGLTADVTVVLADGTYELAEPLVLGPEDGGTAVHAVTYSAAPGATPVLSGGRRLGGWQRGAGNVWTTTVAEARAGTWYFHQLWVNGRRAIRARTPNEEAPQPSFPLVGADLSADLATHTYTFAPGQLAAWKNLTDVEAVVFGNWEITRKHVAAVDPATGVATMLGSHARPHDAMAPAAGRWTYLENAREFLDAPGEWYLDRQTGEVSYWPRPGEDLATATVVAPVLVRLLEVRGTPEDPVQNLHFRGLEIAYSDWAIPPGGYLGIQATHFTTGKGWNLGEWGRIAAAMTWDYAERCSFSDGAFRHLGGAGLALGLRCRDSLIEGNLVTDISANGINLGGPREEVEVPRNTRIANNHIHACGLGYAGAVGLWIGFAQGTVVTHNLVHDLPYSGISMGWQWNPEPTAARGNTIEYNHIYDVMKRLGDGGGIYTLGLQPGSLIVGNHIHDIRRSSYAQAAPNNGIFFDEGSTGFQVADNLIYATSGEPIRFNQTGREAFAWGENHFGLAQAVPGKVGPALHCDGSSGGIEFPHAPELDPVELTAEAWVRLPALVTEGDSRRWVVNKNDDEWTATYWGLVTDRDRVGAYLNIGGGEANMIGAWSPEKTLAVDTWQHVACTYDGRDLRVYLEGREVAVTAVNQARQPGTLPLAIGRRQDAHNVFLGDIDEVRLYRRALTAAEVAARAAAAGAPPPAGLPVAGYWGFDDLGESLGVIRASEAKAGLEPAYRARLAPAP